MSNFPELDRTKMAITSLLAQAAVVFLLFLCVLVGTAFGIGSWLIVLAFGLSGIYIIWSEFKQDFRDAINSFFKETIPVEDNLQKLEPRKSKPNIPKPLNIIASFIAHLFINTITIILIFLSAYVWANDFEVPFPPTKIIDSLEATSSGFKGVAGLDLGLIWTVWLGFSISALFCAFKDNRAAIGQFLYLMTVGLPFFLYLLLPSTLSSGPSGHGFVVWMSVVIHYPFVAHIRFASCLFFILTVVISLSTNFVSAFLLVMYVIVPVSLSSLLLVSIPALGDAIGSALRPNSILPDTR